MSDISAYMMSYQERISWFLWVRKFIYHTRLGSEYRNDMNAMAQKLDFAGADYVLVDPLAERGIEQQHCFVAAERVDPVAADVFIRLTAFLKEKVSD